MSDKADIRRQTKEEKAVNERINRAVDALLTVPDGREFLWWLLTISRFGVQPHVVGAPDATSFACGEVNIGLQLFARMMEVNPDRSITLIKEQQYDRSNARRTRNADADGADRDADDSDS